MLKKCSKSCLKLSEESESESDISKKNALNHKCSDKIHDAEKKKVCSLSKILFFLVNWNQKWCTDLNFVSANPSKIFVQWKIDEQDN